MIPQRANFPAPATVYKMKSEFARSVGGNSELARQVFYEQVTAHLQREQTRIYRLAYSYVGNEQDALDIMQTAMIKALTASPMKEPQYLRTWVYRIVVNTAIDWLRARRRLVPVEDAFFDDLSAGQDPPADTDLQRSLDALPTEYRTIVTLRFFEELKLEEIAEITGLNLNTVKSRLYRALQLLRVEMEDESNG
jgi:RNA polymerase sigma-70 factor (ECF subfamily)